MEDKSLAQLFEPLLRALAMQESEDRLAGRTTKDDAWATRVLVGDLRALRDGICIGPPLSSTDAELRELAPRYFRKQ